MMLSRLKIVPSLLSASKAKVTTSMVAGIQDFRALKVQPDIEWPERSKLKIMEKVPQYPPSMRPFKMQKRLRYRRGPELIHTELIYKQFGIKALIGGRLKYEHFEMIRMTFLRRFNFDKLFAVWRVDPPWQPVTKKGQGQKMGGGKGPIDHYITPIKAGRIIVEVAGNIEYFEIRKVMENVANKMPFAAKAVTHEMMLEDAEKEKTLEETNVHPWTWKYMIQNNIGGCHNWITPADKIWYNKHR